MRFILILTVTFLINNITYSQNNIKWCYKNNNSINGVSYGNTFLEGRLLTDSTEESQYYLSDTYFYANVVSDSIGRVYIDVPNYGITGLLLYDFSLETGDTMFYNWGGLTNYLYEFDHYKIVTATDSILINGTQRKIITLQSYGGNYYESSLHTWIEGYGSIISTGFLNPLQTDIVTNGDSYSFNCVKENDTLIYSSQACECESSSNNIKHIQLIKPKIEITNSKVFIEYEGNYIVKLIDLTGKIILNKKLYGNNTVDIKSFQNGLYILNVSNNYINISEKIEL